MARSAFSLDGVALDQPGVWQVGYATRLHVPAEISRASVSLPGRAGVVPVPASRVAGPGVWQLGMVLYADNYAGLLDRKAALEALASPSGRMVTIVETVGSTTLSAEGWLAAAPVPELVDLEGRVLEVEMEFQIPSGVWLEPAATVSAAAVGAHTGAALAGGSAPQTRVVVKATPAAAGAVHVRLESVNDPGAWVALQGTVTTGEITIDVPAINAAQGAASLTGLLDVGPRPFHIGPDGRFKVTHMAGVPSVAVTSRKAWW